MTWIDVVDTAVKVGLGALISAISGFFVLAKNQAHENSKEARIHFYKLQEERKTKYVEFLAQSLELLQCHLFSSARPDSDEYKTYLRTLNEVQIISDDRTRMAAHYLASDVGAFIFLSKNQHDIQLEKDMKKSAQDRAGYFQKVAQEEVMKCYQKT
ncbi:MAG: hypothetical protein ACO1PZ_05550 [Gammaproteobacteria bacterium]